MTENIFSDKTRGLSGSAIRETFKALQNPALISFAGGSPSADLFPKCELSEIAARIFAEKGSAALSYGITEGYAPLRELVKNRLVSQGVITQKESVVITTGGQQAIDLATKALINEGDVIVTELPSFVGALNCFRSYNARLLGVGLEADGMDVDFLENEILKKNRVKMLYVIPTFQNPSGITMGLAKREKLLELASRYNFYILEDNPYGELRYSGADVPTIKSLDSEGRVIYAGSFSKTLAPGLRVGFFSAREDILEKMAVCKQVTDVHTPILNQMVVHDFVTTCDFEAHIEKGRALYGAKCALMLERIDADFPDYCVPTRPEGGIFLWCALPGEFDSAKLAKAAMAAGVVFVPGGACMIDTAKTYPSFRLNFSNASDGDIKKGIGILAEVLKK